MVQIAFDALVRRLRVAMDYQTAEEAEEADFGGDDEDKDDGMPAVPISAHGRCLKAFDARGPLGSSYVGVSAFSGP